VIAPPRDQAVVAAEVQAFVKLCQQILGHLIVVDETHRVGLAAAFQAARHTIQQALRDALVQLQLCIARNFEDIGFGALNRKNAAENLRQAVPDDVFENDKNLSALALLWWNLDEPAHAFGGDFEQRVADLLFAVQLYRQINGGVGQLRQRVQIIN